MAAPVCKFGRLVPRPDNLVHEVENAIGAALSGRPGPVHLTIPVDVWSQPLEAPPLTKPRVAAVEPRGGAAPEGLRTTAGGPGGAGEAVRLGVDGRGCVG